MITLSCAIEPNRYRSKQVVWKIELKLSLYAFCQGLL